MELFIDKQKWRTQCGQSTKFLCLVLMLFTCGKIQYLCRECKFYGYILKLVANGKHYCNLGPLFLLKKKQQLYFMIVSFVFCLISIYSFENWSMFCLLSDSKIYKSSFLNEQICIMINPTRDDGVIGTRNDIISVGSLLLEAPKFQYFILFYCTGSILLLCQIISYDVS